MSLKCGDWLTVSLVGLLAYYQMAASNLGVEEWTEFLSRPGYQGRSGAQVANRRSFGVFQRISWQNAWYHLEGPLGNSGGYCYGLLEVSIQRDGAVCSVHAHVVRFGSLF